ncbi:hypothetical protein [Nitrospira sp. BLG_2]|uniref:hypothetical protein n=1 Tax=Nitrospira sp. BLG_2 TaxID=3397507 RepID=UPI003B9CC800
MTNFFIRDPEQILTPNRSDVLLFTDGPNFGFKAGMAMGQIVASRNLGPASVPSVETRIDGGQASGMGKAFNAYCFMLLAVWYFFLRSRRISCRASSPVMKLVGCLFPSGNERNSGGESMLFPVLCYQTPYLFDKLTA